MARQQFIRKRQEIPNSQEPVGKVKIGALNVVFFLTFTSTNSLSATLPQTLLPVVFPANLQLNFR